MNCNDKIFCSIKAGINTCNICLNNANFSTSIPQVKHVFLPNMHLFQCGHGMCEDCYKQYIEKNDIFNCPFCRKSGLTIASFDYSIILSLQARGIFDLNEDMVFPTKIVNTYSDYLKEWDDKNHSLYSNNNIFMIMKKKIFLEEKNKIENENIKKYKNYLIKRKKFLKKKRAISREQAKCKICKKNTFTSLKQLEIHINAKHNNKI